MDLWGSPLVTDRIGGATLTRHARSFFQGNRYLLTPLVEHVIGLIDDRRASSIFTRALGLFSVGAAVAGRGPVIAVEGDRFSADDLRRNAEGHDISGAASGAVEKFLERAPTGVASVIVDPPRTGHVEGSDRRRDSPARRRGWSMCRAISRRWPVMRGCCSMPAIACVSAQAFDLFPNTAHVETVIAFAR